jgi:Heterokaryon incompatibility protein Het-C
MVQGSSRSWHIALVVISQKITSPKDHADNLDATEYDPRLRGPVNERIEIVIDAPGLKNWIADEQAGIMTSALHARKLFWGVY